MRPIKLICDSAADLNPKDIQDNFIKVVPLYVSFDGEIYRKESEELSQFEFYQKASGGIIPKTSCPAVSDYADAFEEYAKPGYDIICICMSAKLSGSCQSARNAANLIKDEIPEARITVIDSIAATGSQALLILEAARMIKDGLDYNSVIDNVERLKNTSGVIFTLDSLDALRKGGRIGKCSAFFGTLLNIKPILLLTEGELSPVAKVRGRKKATASLFDYIKKNHSDQSKYIYSWLRFTNDPESVSYKQKFPGELEFNVGATIGAHTGTTAYGIAFIEKYDYVDKKALKEQQRAERYDAKIEKKQSKLKEKIDKLEAKKKH